MEYVKVNDLLLNDYKITYNGNIYSYKIYPNDKLLSPYIDKDGYKCVSLRVDNRSKAFKVHRLVAFTFVENLNNYKQVNHKDGNKSNNHYTNLEWCTNVHNQRHAWDNDLRSEERRVGKE